MPLGKNLFSDYNCNKLSLNPTKSNYLKITPKLEEKPPQIFLKLNNYLFPIAKM